MIATLLRTKKTSRLQTTGMFIFWCVFGMMQIVHAETKTGEALPKARDILSTIQEKTRNFSDMSSEVEMSTIESNGKSTQRSMEFLVLQGPNGDWVKSLLVFKKPKREKGIALLSHAFKAERNRQWLYFPSAKRVKSIAGKKSSGAFMGSEFRYSDLLPKPLDDFNHKTVGKKNLGDRPHWLIKRTLKENNQGDHQMLWVDADHETVKQVEFFSSDGELIKTLSADQFEMVDEVQRPKLLVMKNHKNGRSTELLTLSMAVNSGLIEEDFSETALDFSR